MLYGLSGISAQILAEKDRNTLSLDEISENTSDGESKSVVYCTSRISHIHERSMSIADLIPVRVCRSNELHHRKNQCRVP